MSSFLKELINPLTKRKQVAWCLDGHLGPHQYGYVFKKDGTDPKDFFELSSINLDNCDTFNEKEIVEAQKNTEKIKLKIVSYEPQVTSGCFWCEKDNGSKILVDLVVDGSLELPGIMDSREQEQAFLRNLVGKNVEVDSLSALINTANGVKIL